jgi:uncharacterized alpha-E superfamily protein
MLSRIAENLYWIGRYVERAENTARLLDVNYYAIVEAAVVPRARGAATKSIVTEQWAPLLTMTGDEQAFRAHFERADGRTVPEWLAFHARNSSSIRSSLARARENARTLRDRISLEMWEALNRAYLQLCFDTEQVLEQDRLHEYCVAARETSHLFLASPRPRCPGTWAGISSPPGSTWSGPTTCCACCRSATVTRGFARRWRAVSRITAGWPSSSR